MKSGNLNFLEPSGPLQACNGTALPLKYITGIIKFRKIRGAGDKRGSYKFFVGKTEEKNQMEALGLNGVMILK